MNPRRERGYALVAIMLVVTLLLVSLTAVLPSVYQEGQREREEELLFRGVQYARAIALFHRQFQRYPTSVKELLQTNGIRFLRQEYKDPMDPKGKWRFIHANAAGVLLDSKTQSRPGGGAPGTSSNMFQTQNSGSSSGFGMSSGGFGANSSGFGGSSGMNSSSFQSSTFSGGTTGSMSGTSQMMTPLGGSPQTGSESKSAFSGPASGGMSGAYIVGVASTSHKSSIRVWNNRTRYDEWEFLGIDLNVLGTPVMLPGLPDAGGMQTGQPTGPAQSGFGGSSFGAQPTPQGGSQPSPQPTQPVQPQAPTNPPPDQQDQGPQ